MLGKLFLLFTITTTIELFLLIEMGKLMGVGATLGLILLTGFVGAWLARREGLRTLGRVQQEIAQGKMPGDSLIDGLCILLAGAFLVTPGILTDAFGFLLLTPAVRTPIKRALRARFEQAVREGRAAGRVTIVQATPDGAQVFEQMLGRPGPRPRDPAVVRRGAPSPYSAGEIIDVTEE